tara:strand:- start:164 stop:427 length:264 start_codon:yes stop_codon:yes gene_type:complete
MMNDKTFYTFLIISGVLLTFFLLVTFLFSLLKIYMDIHISSHGLFALFLGCFFSFVLVGLLTFLVFLSHQKGFDEQVINSPEKIKKR